MIAHFPKSTARVFPSFRDIFRILRLNVATNLRARARQASIRFVTRRERAAFFSCAAACPLPCFSPFSSFPLFGRAISVFSERFFNHLHPKKLNDIFVCKLDVLFWYSHNQVWFFECNLVCDFLGWNITVFHIVWYPPDFKIKTWYTEVLI